MINKIFLPLAVFVFALFSCNNDTIDVNSKTELDADTLGKCTSDFVVTFSKNWKVIKNYKGINVFAIDYTSALDTLNENISIQAFYMSKREPPKMITKLLFNSFINDFNEYSILSENDWISKNNIKYYFIEYKVPYNNIFMQGVLFCTIKNNKAYAIVCTESAYEFETTFKSKFLPVIQSFKLK